ncbi:hypothetical protein [Virgibacillus oceani]|uniref:Uncharacterized protein n=1 Tax=Virgibacillus oceani TaxID=1479511 RepID=A0A917H1V6_9BACI|nr:hypothetical protein [Virgibacillus oceani]GGG64839.1 hypothetical protein GCM10011398_05590 [Virgibacillus oceani]
MYIWVKYADDIQGNGMGDASNGKRYIGLAENKTSSNDSVNPNDYVWSPVKE